MVVNEGTAYLTYFRQNSSARATTLLKRSKIPNYITLLLLSFLIVVYLLEAGLKWRVKHSHIFDNSLTLHQTTFVQLTHFRI